MARFDTWRLPAAANPTVSLLAICLLAICLLAMAAPAHAQTPAGSPADTDSLSITVSQTVETAKQTQVRLDGWSQERKDLELRYRNANANLTYLQERLSRERERAAALDNSVGELERSLRESTRLQEGIVDTMGAVLGRLEAAVSADLPFLPEERAARLESLRKLMARTEVESAEKLRVLLETMLIEAQYGATVEVAPAIIRIDGQEVHAEILRIGRLAMYWRSPDGKRVGSWDPAGAAWVELSSGYSRVISHSIEIAAKRRANELVTLPLGRISR